MKKFAYLISILLIIISLSTPALAASVLPQTIMGSAINSNDYTPPDGYIVYQIPNSNADGTYIINFTSNGLANIDRDYTFTATIGTLPNNNYNQVLLWISNFPIYGVIVSGENSFNLYLYDTSIREDRDLVAPTNQSGFSDNISYIAIVIPDNFSQALQTTSLTPVFTIANTILLLISIILLGIIIALLRFLIFGSQLNILNTFINIFKKKSGKHNFKHKEKECDEQKEEECDDHTEKECEIEEDKGCYYPNGDDPFDCNLEERFPYTNNFHELK